MFEIIFKASLKDWYQTWSFVNYCKLKFSGQKIFCSLRKFEFILCIQVLGSYSIKFEYYLGKRSCPGETFAQIEVFLCFVSLLQKFKIVPVNEVVYEEEIGLISQPRIPVVLNFENRF